MLDGGDTATDNWKIKMMAVDKSATGKLVAGHAMGRQLKGLVWLKLFNAKLSLKTYWQRPRFQEMGQEGDCNDHTVSTAKAVLMQQPLRGAKSQRLSINHPF